MSLYRNDTVSLVKIFSFRSEPSTAASARESNKECYMQLTENCPYFHMEYSYSSIFCGVFFLSFLCRLRICVLELLLREKRENKIYSCHFHTFVSLAVYC